MFEPFDVTYTVRVPIPTTPGVSSHYTVEILALMNGQTPEFSVCQFKVISVGSGLNCLLPEDLETVYSSRSGGIYQESDKATIDLGKLKEMHSWFKIRLKIKRPKHLQAYTDMLNALVAEMLIKLMSIIKFMNIMDC